MYISENIITCQIKEIKRFKSFFLHNETTLTAHLPNSGSMKTLNTPGLKAWLRHTPAPTRSTDYTAEVIVTAEGTPVGVYSARANDLVARALTENRIPALAGYSEHRREVTFGDSRFDFLLDGRTFVEVKSVQMSRTPGVGEFPDARTARGVKHLRGLAAAKAQGFRAVLLFCAQRADVHEIRLAGDIDPAYVAAAREAAAAGVEFLGVRCSVAREPDDIIIRVTDPVPVILTD